ncbi:threonine/serine dehydratase [Natronospirillum operosum]|uniref:Threonine/serine dehydratase n=1 Tax=Natronospirillum operosum TaxID=2759953 RepID=A0A4Z0WG62_9GAMM|nr:threonine/serine dehydratase [Natronospirillum operosum]TGG94216.1 threonine/serine dehydratase [Natronospirillum operosum]
MNQELLPYPSLKEIRETAERLHGRVLETPVWPWQAGVIAGMAPHTEVWLKLELWQQTGTFKARGALNSIDALPAEQRQRGVVTVSAGNHAIALAYAAAQAGISARVVMPESASPARIATCRKLGAEVELVSDVHVAFARCREIEAREGRTLVHPFEGPRVAEGTGTVGLEMVQQMPDLDAVIVPVGGGGLIAGVAAAIKQVRPGCRVFGVEPWGADSMYRSLAAGEPVQLERVDTIADSLGAPLAMPYSFGVCQRFVDEVVRVSDDQLCQAMWHLFNDMKLVTEPATAAGTAALLGPLRERLEGSRVGIVLCGANTDHERFHQCLQRGRGSI